MTRVKNQINFKNIVSLILTAIILFSALLTIPAAAPMPVEASASIPSGLIDVTRNYAGATIAIKSVQSEHYISINLLSTIPFVNSRFQRHTPYDWETFIVIVAFDGWAALRSNAAHGRLLSTMSDGSIGLSANQGWGAQEAIRFYQDSRTGFIYIKSQINGKFWTAMIHEPEAPIIAHAAGYICNWERFTIRIISAANMASELIHIAESQIGYREKRTNSQLDNFTANAGSGNFTKYGQWYGMNGQPWCAIFISWCANQAGISTNIIPKFASCTIGMNWFKNRGQWADRGSRTPQSGDIIFFGSGNTSNHVGIVTEVDNLRVHTIEGNTSDSVARRSYLLTNTWILGYGITNY
jgi:hypothetical protein